MEFGKPLASLSKTSLMGYSNHWYPLANVAIKLKNPDEKSNMRYLCIGSAVLRSCWFQVKISQECWTPPCSSVYHLSCSRLLHGPQDVMTLRYFSFHNHLDTQSFTNRGHEDVPINRIKGRLCRCRRLHAATRVADPLDLRILY